MKQVLYTYRTGKLRLVDLPRPTAAPGTIVVAARTSVISSATERSALRLARKNLLGKVRDRPDLVGTVLNKARREGPLATMRSVDARLRNFAPLGYSLSGVVVATGMGVSEFSVGQRVACGGAGYATHAEMNVIPVNLAVPIEDRVPDEEAAFVSVGAIALHALRLANVDLGAVVVVIGLGLVGQLAVQLAVAQGVRVVGVDVDPRRTSLALEYGATAAGLLDVDDIRGLVSLHTRGRGADAVVVAAASASNSPLELAGAIARDRAQVVVVGDLPLRFRRRTYYEKELSVVVSRSYGPGRYDENFEVRGHDYPIGYVRWTERRNLETVIDCMAQEKIDVRRLITHRFPFDRALEAYDVVLHQPPTSYLGIVLVYPGSPHGDAELRVAVPASPAVRSTSPKEALGVGVLGTGVFARSVLLPELAALARAGGVRLVAAASAHGVSAANAATRFGFDEVVGSVEELLAHPGVQAVVIATRHSDHADQTCRALRSGKHVFVEKPLAINPAQLEELEHAYQQSSGVLMVGFNRRFAPLAREVRRLFRSRRSGLLMSARITRGTVESASWVQVPSEGGGRIVGEACHFVDLMTYWAGAPVVGVAAQPITTAASPILPSENLIITLAFEDGSAGTILYTSMGAAVSGSELFELHGDGVSVRVDDWRTMWVAGQGRDRTIRRLTADKGHEAELGEFVQACRYGRRPGPTPWREIVATTEATFVAAGLLSQNRLG